jgi:hypothetical protein
MGQQEPENTDKEIEALWSTKAMDMDRRRRRRGMVIIVATIAIGAITCVSFMRHEPICGLPMEDLTTVFWPVENIPEAWLARSQKAHEDDDATIKAYMAKKGSSDNVQAHRNSMNRIDVETMAKLTAIGKPSIEPCLNKIKEQSTLSGIAMNVLANLGDQSIEPMLSTLLTKADYSGNLIEVFRRMKENPGDYLARLACSSGVQRVNAIGVLAYFMTNRDDVINRGTLMQPNAISEQNRQPLLVQLHNEQNIEIKRDLLVVQRYFKSANSASTSEISQILEHGRTARLRATAAEVLGSQLENSSSEESKSIIRALTTALSGPNPDSVKIACARAFLQAKSKCDDSSIRELKKVVGGNNYPLRETALQALCHLAIYDKACLPDLAQALKEEDSQTVNTAKDALQSLVSTDQAAVEQMGTTGSR